MTVKRVTLLFQKKKKSVTLNFRDEQKYILSFIYWTGLIIIMIKIRIGKIIVLWTSLNRLVDHHESP